MPLKVNIKTRIRFNGQDYDSVDAMPPEAREIYEQALARGVVASGQGARVTATRKVVVNGREYASPDELPPELRAQYDKLMDTLDANHNGVPDMLEHGTPTRPVSPSGDDASRSMESLTKQQDPRRPQASASIQGPASFPVVSAEPSRNRRRMVLVLALVILLAGLAALGVALLLYGQFLSH